MLAAAAQPSLRGALESVFAWKGSKGSRPVPEQRSRQRNRDIFSVVMTPDRIPKFCIPSLEVDHFTSGSEMVRETCGRSLGSNVSGKMTPKLRPFRSKSEFCLRTEGMALNRTTWCRRETLCLTDDHLPLKLLERAADHSDPVTRAALSLLHLPKITTPYGFLTLGESPNIRRKESLFFGYGSAELRLRLSQKKDTPCLLQHSAKPLIVHEHSRSWKKLSNKSSLFASGAKPCTKQAAPHLPQGLTSERCTDKCERKRFQQLIKRHLASIKKLSAKNRAGDRVIVSTEKSFSRPTS